MTASAAVAPPKKGEVFRCTKCGMELQITQDCQCKGDAHVHFECCGQEMAKK